MRRFQEAGIRPQTRHGQNFLIDLNLLRVLFDAAHLEPGDVVLEVGTGTGALTCLMAPRVAHVVTVEIDPRLFQLAREELAQAPGPRAETAEGPARPPNGGWSNVTMLNLDALQGKHRFAPAVLEAVRKQLGPGRQFKLVANLPYSVATPVLTNALALDQPPRTMTVTIQKELAERILASPCSKDYGALSVWIQCQCRVKLVRVIPPQAFWPRPKVESAMVHIELDDGLRARVRAPEFFHQFVRSLFLHRRKFLRSGLLGAYKAMLSKGDIDQIMASLALPGDARAEQLAVPALLALSDVVQHRLRARGCSD
jgi:16S rRNA (adenine1518-N6/adenine1519-N6)-dimethyltransferase